MELVLPTPDQALPILRALRTAAAGDGPLAQQERAMLDAAQEIFGTPHDPDTLEPISPEALAAAIQDRRLRWQLVNGMVIISMLDEVVTADKHARCAAFAAALGVELDELKNLRQIADGQLGWLRLDVARRVWLKDHLIEKWRNGGVRWLATAIATLKGALEDTPLATRYRALGELPEGTVGRVYHDHMRECGFPLPGERGSTVEPQVIHDITHLLAGYGTDAEGEILTAAFSAGYRRRDPFTFIFFVVCQFHLGLTFSAFAPPFTGKFDARSTFLALRRGAAMNTDISEGWDPWSVMHRPLDEVRRELGVPPLEPAAAR
ncbi:MAG: hypothetical protein H6713_18525 [Myxococcales bacterium]|nr:hypothetical protein [Myxococcales bacterium]MCB9751975.1 hypothetical protein [Myxococcales bacterium]